MFLVILPCLACNASSIRVWFNSKLTKNLHGGTTEYLQLLIALETSGLIDLGFRGCGLFATTPKMDMTHLHPAGAGGFEVQASYLYLYPQAW